MLKVQRRHTSTDCKRGDWDAGYLKCSCPLIILGTLGGRRIRLAAGKFIPAEKARSLRDVRALADIWEATGEPVHPPVDVSATVVADGGQVTIEDALRAFLDDGKTRELSEATLSKKQTVFGRNLPSFAAAKGLRFLTELDLAMLREWRSSWTVNALTRFKRQKSVIGFLWFCERSGWFPRNYAAEMTRALGKIEVRHTQTGYFTPDEYRKILDATWLYSDCPGKDHTGYGRDGGQRIRTVMELMRWTGLRIRDAVTLEKSRLTVDPATGMSSIFLYQAKTGEPVYCPIPPHVAALLSTVPASQKGNANNTWFFWTGHGHAKTLASNWERSFRKLFALADLRDAAGNPKRAFPHMFRDTFAVESLLGEVPLPDVSKMLGHSSIKVTEDHYMPWVLARQSSLNQAVIASWERQGVVAIQPRLPQRRVIPMKRAG